MNIDIVYDKLLKSLETNNTDSAKEYANQLKDLIGNLDQSMRYNFLKNVESFVNNNDAEILDFGSGGGRSVVYLYLLGYQNVYGIDLNSQERNNKIMKLLGSDKIHFTQYDGSLLPFENSRFDLVFSEQVLEHVKNVPLYYSETFRVLKSQGVTYHIFPHRLMPFDSHTRTWFIHMLPYTGRKVLFKLLGHDFEYNESLLNFKTISYHISLLKQYSNSIDNLTEERLLSFGNKELEHYEGNRRIRLFVDKLIKNKYFGKIFLKLLSNLAIAELKILKDK